MTYVFKDDREKKVEEKLEELIVKCRTFENEVNNLKNVVAAQGIYIGALNMLFDKNNLISLEELETAKQVVKDNLVEKQNG